MKPSLADAIRDAGGAQRVQLRGFGLMERAVRSEANIKVGSECGTAGGKHGPVRDEPF